jgi:hypothetical protein
VVDTSVRIRGRSTRGASPAAQQVAARRRARRRRLAERACRTPALTRLLARPASCAPWVTATDRVKGRVGSAAACRMRQCPRRQVVPRRGPVAGEERRLVARDARSATASRRSSRRGSERRRPWRCSNLGPRSRMSEASSSPTRRPRASPPCPPGGVAARGFSSRASRRSSSTRAGRPADEPVTLAAPAHRQERLRERLGYEAPEVAGRAG